MFSKSQFITLFNFNWHTSERMLAGAARLPDTAYLEQPGYGHGSLHDLFVHTLQALKSWRHALETGQQQSGVKAEDYADLAAIAAALAEEKAAWDALLAGYSAADIEGNITLTTWRGTEMTFPLWRILQHLALHGMQHHTELAALLTAHGESPGDIDFIFYRGQ